MPLYTASAETKFLLADRAAGDDAGESEKTFLTRRPTAKKVGKTLNVGLLAARRAGEAVPNQIVNKLINYEGAAGARACARGL